jgi:transcriptional regulator with XRE-family HTH domain
MKISEKKDWAKLLYTREGLTQKEIASRVGVSAVTVCNWVKKENWDLLKQSLLVTKDQQLRRLYLQLDELNTKIMSRPSGDRFPDSKEADTINKLTGSIRTMETEASIADIVEVSKRLLGWLQPINPAKAMELAGIFDEFIKESLKR